jgi:hypothetical protein
LYETLMHILQEPEAFFNQNPGLSVCYLFYWQHQTLQFFGRASFILQQHV